MNELKTILEEIGFPYAYSHFAKGEVPDFPYICYQAASSDPFSADGKVYKDFLSIDLELYTAVKDIASENKIRSVLDRYDIFYSRTETWIPDQELYQVWFSFEMEDE